MSDLGELQDLVVRFRDERDWKQFHNPKDIALSLVLESAEVLEQFQWKNEAEIKQYLEDNKDRVADEVADVLYWILLIANDLDINLGKAFEKKLSDNAKKYPVSKAKGKHTKYTEL